MRKLLVHELHQNGTLDKRQAISFDSWSAKAEAYYYQEHQKMMAQEACKYEVAPTWETRPKKEEERAGAAETWHHTVPEGTSQRETARAERARGLSNHRESSVRFCPPKQ